MPIRKFNPTSPGSRFHTVQTFDEITTNEPYRPLTESLHRTGGRNNQGEWIIDPQSGAQMWQPADGGPPISAEDWADKGGDDAPGSDGASEGAAAPDGDQADEPTADADGSGGSDEARPAEAEPAGVPPETEAPPTADPAETGEGVS
jgi:hypothetical protein